MRIRLTIAIGALVVLAATAALVARSQLPGIGAGALLYPARHVSKRVTPTGCIDRIFDGVRARLAGWVCSADPASSKPTIVYLHGIADNRDSSIGVIARFLRPRLQCRSSTTAAGTDDRKAIAARMGSSRSRICGSCSTKPVLIDAILIGHSLGAAVALQTAAIDRRVRAVVAASTFADLRSIATERAPARVHRRR